MQSKTELLNLIEMRLNGLTQAARAGHTQIANSHARALRRLVMKALTPMPADNKSLLRVFQTAWLSDLGDKPQVRDGALFLQGYFDIDQLNASILYYSNKDQPIEETPTA